MVDTTSVVRFEYVLHVAGKEVARQTQTILIGHARHLPAGLEGLLLGCLAGERLERVVPAALAYGPYHPERVVQASPGDFPAGTLLKVGEQFYSEDGTGQAVAYRIVSTNPDFITLDANHPWAGEDLHYRIHLLSVRPAEPEELEHGHVHGEGGVKH